MKVKSLNHDDVKNNADDDDYQMDGLLIKLSEMQICISKEFVQQLIKFHTVSFLFLVTFC